MRMFFYYTMGTILSVFGTVRKIRRAATDGTGKTKTVVLRYKTNGIANRMFCAECFLS